MRVRIFAIAAGLLLVAAACGDSGGTTTTTGPDEAIAPTSTTVAPTTAPPTTAAPTTTSTTTTMPPTTTTTVPPTTTTAAPADPQATVDAKVNAVLAVVPAEWTAQLLPDPTAGGDDTDIIFGPCAAPDAFDLNDLDAESVAIEQVDIEAPVGSGGGIFPDPAAQVEARVFSSEEVAVDAFAVLETVLGTEEGRDCLADNLISEFSADLPAGSSIEFEVQEFLLPGADVGIRIKMDIAAGGITAVIFIDINATRMGDCTVYSSFQTFTEPFDADLAGQLFGAALI